MRIAVLGGTGAFGRGLAARFHDLGHEVAIGSRDPTRAHEQAAVIGVQGGANAEVASNADYIVLATASGAAIDTARELRDAIGRTPVLCVASDLRFTKDSVLPGRSQGSVAEDVAALLEAPVASGYQALPAAHLAHPDRLDQDVLVCGDDPAAKDPALTEAERARGADFAQKLSIRVLSRAWQILLKGVPEVQAAARPIAAAEMVLVRLAYAADLPTPDEALRALKDGAPLTSSSAPQPDAPARPSGGPALATSQARVLQTESRPAP